VSLLGASLMLGSCGSEDDPQPDNQTPNNQKPDDQKPDDQKPADEVLVSELKCTVTEFATKYTTLKKGEKVTVTLTDVSDDNLANVAKTLKAMQAKTLSKEGGVQYIIVLVLESVDNELKTIPADIFKSIEVLREVVIPACVEAIKSDAFADCVNLVSAKILGSATKVDEKAFANANADFKLEQAAQDGKYLKFDGNGFKQGSVPEILIYKETVTLPDAGAMLRPGFNFLGWAKTADSKKADYEACASFDGDAEVLYAVWKPYQYVITYYYEHGYSEMLLSGTALESKELVFPTRLSGNNRIFKGWRDEEGNLYAPGAPITIYQDCDLYEVWEDVDDKFSIDVVPVIYYK